MSFRRRQWYLPTYLPTYSRRQTGIISRSDSSPRRRRRRRSRRCSNRRFSFVNYSCAVGGVLPTLAAKICDLN